MKYLILSLFFNLFILSDISSQQVYKTPSGSKYHRYSCRMVDNVSKKMSLSTAVSDYGLKPCKICSPPVSYGSLSPNGLKDKSVGKCTSVQCSGITKKGSRCKHKTRLCNGYCYQHNPDNTTTSKSRTNYSQSFKSKSTRTYSSKCGAQTKSGGSCKRNVKGGGFCYQHK